MTDEDLKTAGIEDVTEKVLENETIATLFGSEVTKKRLELRILNIT
jgi:hypothetical protein